MSIVKRGKTFEVRIIRAALKTIGIESGKYTFTVADKIAAQLKHDEICRLIDTGSIPAFLIDYAKSNKRINAHSTINDVWRHMHTNDQIDISKSSAGIMRVLLDTLGDTIITAFSEKELQKWIASLKTKKNAPGTIRKKVGAVKAIFTYAIKVNAFGLEKNVFDTLQRGYSSYKGTLDKRDATVKRDVIRERRLQSGEYELILKTIENFRVDPRRRKIKHEFVPAMNLVFELAINTAMRLQEIFLMEWGNIDFDGNGIIKIPADITKGNKTRYVPMTKFIKPALKLYKEHFENENYGYVLPFMSEYDNRIKNCSTGISKTWACIVKQAGIDDLRFHDLRHEAVSRMVERTTLTLAQLMNISGHGDLSTFQRYNNLRASDIGELY